MTNLQHHLNGIRKLVCQAVQNTPSEYRQIDIDKIRQQLRDYLPDSYGIGQGVLFSGAEHSAFIPIILYDIPHSQGVYNAQSHEFDIRHVLMVIEVALSHTNQSFLDRLEAVATVKRLETGRTRRHSATHNQVVSQAKFRIPSDRLPYALMVFYDFADYPLEDVQLFERTQKLMKRVKAEHHPDEIQLLGQALNYHHPLLEYDNLEVYDRGLSRLQGLNKTHNCYVCKREFFHSHFFYDRLCVRCGDASYHKRKQSADLHGYRIVITGARVKIGFYTALKLLRAGAEVIVTSRFPRDTARRFSEQADFMKWHRHLHIYGLDLRQIPQVEAFVQHLYKSYDFIDVLINNAAQTIKQPPQHYAHLIPLETQAFQELPVPIQSLLEQDQQDIKHLQLSLDKMLTDGIDSADLPQEFDEHGQAIDDRDYTSWLMRMDEIPTQELIEVHMVNAIAPALLAGQLKQLLCNSPHAHRHIINVSAAEGRFSQFKMGTHPHTNMAKAALNMLTRTIADEYRINNIYVNCVDPGWVSDQFPRSSQEERKMVNHMLPIDMEDAAARLCDLLFSTQADLPHGKLIKDYRLASW